MKTIRLSLAVAADKLADVVDMLANAGYTPTLMGSSQADATTDVDDDEEEEVAAAPAKRGRKVAAATMTAAVPTQPRHGGNRGPVVYTPAKTAKQIAAVLDGLRKNTVGAFVLADIVKHPGTSKRDMLTRLEPKLSKHGLALGSVDNAVWLLQNQAVVKSVPAPSEE